VNNSHTGSFSNHGFSSRGGGGGSLPINQSIIQLSNIAEWPWDLSYPAVSVGGVDWGTNEGFHGFVFPEGYTVKRIFGMIHYCYNNQEVPGSVNLRFRKVWADGSQVSAITPPTGSLLGNVPVVIPVGEDMYYLGFDSGGIDWNVSANFLFYGYVQSAVLDVLFGISCSALIEWE
jgi:hypothetical protein